MTYPLESKYTTLRRNALHYYLAIVHPASPSEFDAMNPRPRIALDVELGRINEKERKEGRTW